MRRLLTIAVLLGVLVFVAGLMPASASAAHADEARSSRPAPGPVAYRLAATRSTATRSAAAAGPAGKIHIVKVSGLLDPVLADFANRSIGEAEREHAVGVVLQLNSSDAVVSDSRLARLARRMHDAAIPVSVWVGPSGAKAQGKAAQLLGVVDQVAVAPGSSVGSTGDVVVDRSLLRPAFRAQLARLHDGTMGDKTARKTGVATKDGPVLGEFIVGLPGVHTKTIKTAKGPRRQPTTSPVFSQLPILSQLFHTVASPSVAYLLFLIGMVLMVLELYTAGVGVAGLVGAGCFVLGCYGFGVLPVTAWGVGLLVVSMLAFAVDIQTGVPRVWTGIGIATLLVGSLTVYDGMSVPWLALGAGVAGTALFMFAGLPALVRSRFSTPTIGREWMVGEMGEAVVDLSPEGVVRVDGGLWRARTNRATPIGAGGTVRVSEVQGLLLRVEAADPDAPGEPAVDDPPPAEGVVGRDDDAAPNRP